MLFERPHAQLAELTHAPARALVHGSLDTVAATTLASGAWTAIDVHGPAVLALVAPMDAAGLDTLKYLELFTAPESVPLPNLPAIRASGARAWLFAPGRWFVQVLSDVAQRINYVLIDAPSDAWANAYVNAGASSANTVRRGYAGQLSPGGDDCIFNVAELPDVRSVTIRVLNAASVIVNVGDATDGGDRGAEILGPGELTFDASRFGAASVFAFSDDGARLEVYVTA